MYHTVVFDLDGTLLNTLEDLAGAANAVCAQNGWPQRPVNEYRYLVGNGIPKLVERFSPPDARTPAQLAATLDAFLFRYSCHMQDCTAPYAGILPLLAQLEAEGVQMAVLSNKQDELARQVVRSYFPDCFALVRGALPQVPVKPDPAGVHLLLKELSADPAQTLFVGDSNVDILTAKNTGLDSCGVLWGFRDEAELAAAGADHLAADPAALQAIILQGPRR